MIILALLFLSVGCGESSSSTTTDYEDRQHKLDSIAHAFAARFGADTTFAETGYSSYTAQIQSQLRQLQGDPILIQGFVEDILLHGKDYTFVIEPTSLLVGDISYRIACGKRTVHRRIGNGQDSLRSSLGQYDELAVVAHLDTLTKGYAYRMSESMVESTDNPHIERNSVLRIRGRCVDLRPLP
jgi:hypothetical protein